MFQVVELGGVQTLVSLAKSDKLVIQVIHFIDWFRDDNLGVTYRLSSDPLEKMFCKTSSLHTTSERTLLYPLITVLGKDLIGQSLRLC